MNTKGDTKPVIVQHCAMPNSVGGPMTGLKLLMGSLLNQKYHFRTVFQTRPARGFNLRLIWEMACQIRQQKPSIVHIRGLQNEGFHGILAARIAGCKHIVLSVHGRIGELTNVHPFKRWIFNYIIEPITLRLAHRYYCVCYAQAGALKNNPAFAGVIYNAVNKHCPLVNRSSIRESIGVCDGEILSVYTGRLTIDKGLIFLADALNSTFETACSSKLKFIFVGEGPLEIFLKERLATHCATGRIQFLGSRNDVQDILGGCDMFVFPTLHENLSNSLLEACSAGLAIVATNVGGNPEVVRNGAEAILVTPGCSKALTNAMVSLINDAARRESLGQAALLRSTTVFSPEATWHLLGGLYDKLISGTSNR